MLRFHQKARTGIALVAIFFLWCQASQVMAFSGPTQTMDCSNTILCGVCTVALHSDFPEFGSPSPAIWVPVPLSPHSLDPHPLTLYHPPR